MLEFASERWCQVSGEFDVLGEQSFKECGIGEGLDYAPDYDTLETMDKIGALRLTTARFHGKLIGYVMNIITPRHLMFKAKCSQMVSVFLLPEHRKGTGIGLKLLAQDRAYMKDLGVQKMYRGDTIQKELEPIFIRDGWKKVENVYVRWIDG